MPASDKHDSKYRTQIHGAAAALLILLAFSTVACRQQDQASEQRGPVTIVFKHGKMGGDPGSFQKLLDQFEWENPGTRVRSETLPSSTDEQHQFYVINLESRSSDFDVLSVDVIWVPEFARAGWLRDVTHLLSDGEQNDFFPGPMKAVTYQQKMYAVPWYIDAGVLFYRRDLLTKYRREVPRTWHDLVETSRYIMDRERGLYGYIWTGKQYEGLVCNALEFIWSNGGDVLRDGKAVLAQPREVEAIRFMRDLITESRVTPPLVTNVVEESARYLFGSGKAVFMRNWPYAWTIFQHKDSPVRGKFGIAPLPVFPGHDPASVLGGWQLAVNQYSRHPREAEKLVRFLMSLRSQKLFALKGGLKPVRKSLYKDRDLLQDQPDMAVLYGIFLKARPRPVTPYYMMITGVMQPAFSAAISGIKTPEEALESAQKQIEHILGVEQ